MSTEEDAAVVAVMKEFALNKVAIARALVRVRAARAQDAERIVEMAARLDRQAIAHHARVAALEREQEALVDALASIRNKTLIWRKGTEGDVLREIAAIAVFALTPQAQPSERESEQA